MVPPTSHKVPRVSWYSGYCRCLPISITRLSLSMAGFPKTLLLSFSSLLQSITPDRTRSGLSSFPFARRYSENRCFFLFLRVLRCFSSPRYLLCTYVFSTGYLRITTGGFPHSDICGFTDICSSPQLFAACHVLLRLPVPRHPPYALFYLTFKFAWYSVTRSFSSLSVNLL